MVFKVLMVDSVYCHMFDITKKLNQSKISQANLKIINDSDLKIHDNLDGKVYDLLLLKLLEIVDQDAYKQGSRKNVLRLAIDGIGSLEWGDFDQKQHKLFLFIKALKAAVRRLSCVVYITLPAYIYGDFFGINSNPAIRRLEHLVDAVVELESFAGKMLTNY